MITMQPRPLRGPPPGEISLPRAPLARVIAQVRFAPILAIRSPDAVSIFQEKIRPNYPILNEDRIHQIVATGGAPDVREGSIWRFTDDKRQWRASLSVDFVALETSAYLSRQDFSERLGALLIALEASFKPAEVQRLGLRYIDRLTGDAVDRIGELIRPKVLGILQPNKEPPVDVGDAILYLMTEAQLIAAEGRIQARWGKLPENATYDPDALEPINKSSWVLDLDMFTQGPLKFESEELRTTATKFAERIYSVFREMVTDEFLKFFGGEL
jgi:uncharacterized protein (TIGR04255 family)